MKAAIVIPTIREESIRKFLDAWRDEFSGHHVIIVEDRPEPSFKVPDSNVAHYSWEDIDRELGRDSWIVPRCTDCIRSFGFYKAYQLRPDMIVTLDDDCYPDTERFLNEHYTRLNSIACSEAWASTGDGLRPRGIPYERINRELACAVNHGLWTNQPDYDAITQVFNKRLGGKFEPADRVIPRGMYFPMCGMNLAWRPEFTVAMYFLLMGKGWPYDRFGDIWCGLLLKKLCDHLGYGIRSGRPFIEHRRASSQWTNLEKEQPGYETNESLWQCIDAIQLSKGTLVSAYRQLSYKWNLPGDYWKKLRRAMRIWANLFQESDHPVVAQEIQRTQSPHANRRASSVALNGL